MELIIENWRKYLNEGLKIKTEYPQEFTEFLSEVESHKDDLWIMFDTETTGLGYKLDFVQITQIACVAYNTNGFVEGTSPEPIKDGIFNLKVKLQDSTISMKDIQDKETDKTKYRFPISKILKMTNYEEKTVAFLEPAEVIVQFEKYLQKMSQYSPSGKIILIAKNSPFDVGVIHTCYERINRTPPNYDVWDSGAPVFKYFLPVIETMKNHPEATEEDKRISKAITKTDKQGKTKLSTSLGDLIVAFDIEDKGWHEALADVKMSMDVLENVINYVRRVVSKKDIDFSKTKFDAMAGDPYYGGNEPKD